MFPTFLSGPPPVQPLPLLVSSGHAMPPIGQLDDAAKIQPASDSGSNPFSVFSLCSEFTHQEIHNYCSRFDLLTHALNVCHLFPAWLPGAQQLVLTLRSSKTESFRLGQSLIIARTGSQVCTVTAMQHYFQLVAPSSGPYFLFPVRHAPYQVSGHFPLTGYRASCRASFS